VDECTKINRLDHYSKSIHSTFNIQHSIVYRIRLHRKKMFATSNTKCCHLLARSRSCSSRFVGATAAKATATAAIATATATAQFPFQRALFHSTVPTTMAKLNVERLAQKVKLEGQNVLVRVDLNVPLDKVR